MARAAELFPNQSVLIDTLPFLEAKASSEIENIVTTTDKIFEHFNHEEHADPATKEALRYSRAVLEGYRSLNVRPLSTRSAEEICTYVKGSIRSVLKSPGTALHNDLTAWSTRRLGTLGVVSAQGRKGNGELNHRFLLRMRMGMRAMGFKMHEKRWLTFKLNT